MSVYYRKLLENLEPLPTLTEDHYGEPCADQQTVAKNYKVDKLAKEAAHNMLALMIANRRRADYRAEGRLTEEELTEILGMIRKALAGRAKRREALRGKVDVTKTAAARSGLAKAQGMTSRERQAARGRHLVKKMVAAPRGTLHPNVLAKRAAAKGKSAAGIRGSRMPGRSLPQT